MKPEPEATDPARPGGPAGLPLLPLRLPHPEASPAEPSVELPPLRLAGLVVTKAALVEALRIYVPTIADVVLLDQGEHFYLRFQETPSSGQSENTP